MADSNVNNSNWAGPNAAGMGGTPSPTSADDGSGMHGTQYSGDGSLGKSTFPAGPNAVGAAPANTLVVNATGTHVY